MYGDTTPGDITHQDVTLEYSGYFKHAFRNMPKALQESDMEKYRIWEMCADIMKVYMCVFDRKLEILYKGSEGKRSLWWSKSLTCLFVCLSFLALERALF